MRYFYAVFGSIVAMAIGIIVAVALFIYLAMKGVSVFLIALICSSIVVITNGLDINRSIFEYFASGQLGAFTFAGKFFLLFVMGAIFGRVTGESGAAASIAHGLVKLLGNQRILWITVSSTALLTYGGVVVFVVIFAMYPLGIQLLQHANIPKRLFVAALALGSGTFTLSSLPGTPSIQNVIASVSLQTDLFAASAYGIFGSLIMVSLGMWYLENQRKKANLNNEQFVPNARDAAMLEKAKLSKLPPFWAALLPLLVVISTILTPRVISLLTSSANDLVIVNFANSQPILWPCFALLLGIITTITIFPSLHKTPLVTAGKGAEEAIIPLMATAVVIGFGGVVTQTQTFSNLSIWLLALDLNPLISVFISVSFMSAIVGSATGGLQIFMATMSQEFIDRGVDPEILHRIATMASGGFDSLPHCGAIVAVLAIAGLTHKEGYKDIGVITVLIPVVATLLTIALYLAI